MGRVLPGVAVRPGVTVVHVCDSAPEANAHRDSLMALGRPRWLTYRAERDGFRWRVVAEHRPLTAVAVAS